MCLSRQVSHAILIGNTKTPNDQQNIAEGLHLKIRYRSDFMESILFFT